MNKISMASSSETGSQYPYPSTLNPASFVSIKLSGAHDYPRWETQMMCLVESQELVGFIDGTILTPPEMTENGEAAAAGNTVEVVANEEYRLWKRSDRLVKSWILGSLQEIVLDTVLGLTTARSVWTKLHSTFGVNPQEKVEAAEKEKEEEEEIENKEEEIEEEDIGVKEYPYPFTFNVSNVVTIKLTSKANYDLWATQIRLLVHILKLDDFILKEPPLTKRTLLPLWERTDLLLRGWILATISENVYAIVRSNIGTSRRILIKIEETFVQDIDARILSTKSVTERTEKENEEEMEEEDIGVIEYPYPFTFNVSNVVTIKLTKDNYRWWMVQIFFLFDILELVDFINNEPPSQSYLLWKRTDLLLRGWILSTISEDVMKTVLLNDIETIQTSRRIMSKIEETFNQGIHSPVITTKHKPTEIEKSICKYMPLYEATVAGNWEATKSILDGDEEAATAIISENHFTLLHVAVVTGKHIPFLENLVEYLVKLPTDALITTDMYDSTALHIAAKVGNTEAAKILMNKNLNTEAANVGNPDLLSVKNKFNKLPLHTAIDFEQRGTYLYLQSVSSEDHYAGENGTRLLNSMIISQYFDLALDLVEHYPRSAQLPCGYRSPLYEMARMSSCFRSGMGLNFVESFIYSCVPAKPENYNAHFFGGNDDVENPANNTQTLLHHWVHFLGVLRNRLKLMLWDVILLVPSIKIIRQKKLLHHQAVQLVKRLCEAVKSSNDQASFHNRSSEALIDAARFGTSEVVEEILRILPHTIWSRDTSQHTITEIAVINRCEKVFNITCQINELQEYCKFNYDENGNNILHLAGGMAPRDKLNRVSGAALQMQRELQWFKKVENLSNPYIEQGLNSSKETPAMVFTREHKELVIEGEKWMKDTANSCSIAAALIITVVFAAAITVPGGNKDNGPPVFHNPAFLIYAVSDTVALFMSTTSLLMFLSILTARYAEEDFLHTLPKRLVFGLLTLFLSITSMVLAFSTAVYLVFGGRNGWVIISLAVLSFLPVTSFVRLQFPLLIDVFSSTYGRGIFGEQSDSPFHRHIKGFL